MARSPEKSKPTKLPRKEKRAARRERFSQIKQAFTMTRERDSRLVPYLAVAILVPIAIGVGLAFVLHNFIALPIAGVFFAAIAGLQVFSRRVQASAYKEVEGKPGAAAGVVDTLRGEWKLTPAVQYNRNQDFVHRVVGRPGIVLLAEGSQAKRGLLVTEAKRVRKLAGTTPVYEVVVGNDEGEIAIKDLAKHMIKLPRNLKPAEATAVNKRLNALGGASLPIPKGPMPTRIPRGRGM